MNSINPTNPSNPLNPLNPLNPTNPSNKQFNNKNKNKKNKKNKNKNKKVIQQQINEEYANYLEPTPNKTNCILSQNDFDIFTYIPSQTPTPTPTPTLTLTPILTPTPTPTLTLTPILTPTPTPTLTLKPISISKTTNLMTNSKKQNNFIKSKSQNDLKIKEMKETIRRNTSYNLADNIILEISQTDNLINNSISQIKKIKSSNSFSNSNTNTNSNTNKYAYLIGEDDNDNDINNEQDELNKNILNSNNKNITSNVFLYSSSSKKNKKNTIIESKYDDIKNLDVRINDTIDYHLINTPFKIIGEELLNEEINNKYKQKIKTNPENNQIIKKLKETFKKLVHKELKEKPNISQILLDNELTDELKVKIMRKYIKFTTEDEVFSEQADKIKIEIKNLIKQKKIRHTDDYDDLGKQVESKIIHEHLKTKLEDIYYRVIDGDQPKLHNLLNNILLLPFEKKTNILEKLSQPNVIKEEKMQFIKMLYSKLDADLYGLEETKDSIMSWICQKINNPNHNSNKYLCLCGPAGVGKTSIVHSISESLEIPYSYISLANVDEPSSLIGHGYTYEGSQYGSIANGLIKNSCINGILLFDEIDKAKEKVQNTLLGIFDPLQNTKFRDAYFGEFNLNLSESMMILCLNDLDKINPILKDRLHIVRIPGYGIKDKKVIIKNYIIPKLNLQYNIDVNIDETVIDEILEKTKDFQGIRQVQMYLIKIYELMILDLYTYKYNFNNTFGIKNIDLLKIPENSNLYLSMFN